MLRWVTMNLSGVEKERQGRIGEDWDASSRKRHLDMVRLVRMVRMLQVILRWR